MADIQIHPTGTAAAPADFKIPNNTDAQLKVAFANFDGTGAAGAFIPTLRVKSDAGSTVFEAPMSQSIAAGASADVSWFRGGKLATKATVLAVTDGTHTVTPTTTVDFTAGATVSSAGGGQANVAITGYTSPLTTKGDVFGHSTVDARIPVGADNTVLTAASGQALGVQWANVSSLSGGRPNVQVFAAGAGQTWTKPAGTTAVDITCIAAGGGGGGGNSATSTATNGAGGGGGGGGAVTRVVMQASDVPGTVTVNVGAGGTGGAGGALGAAHAGVAGNNGGNTTFGTLLAAYGGGGGGAAATNGTSTAGGGGGSMAAQAATTTGGAPSTSTNPLSGESANSGVGANGVSSEWGGASGGGSQQSATGRSGGSAIFGGAGGGSGGGGAANAGGIGGTTQSYSTGGGQTGGTTGGGTGNNGTFTGPFCGQGGSGGGAAGSPTNASGGNGGNGGIGSGGGGGGEYVNAVVSFAGGTGGNGGDGRCIVISW